MDLVFYCPGMKFHLLLKAPVCVLVSDWQPDPNDRQDHPTFTCDCHKKGSTHPHFPGVAWHAGWCPQRKGRALCAHPSPSGVTQPLPHTRPSLFYLCCCLQILKSPMSFFDTTPTGRLMNRFSKDMDELDVRLPFHAENFLQQVFMVVFIIVIFAVVFPAVLLVLAGVTVVFIMLFW